jgi:hypothetical protein
MVVPRLAPRLLWIDGLGATVVGLVVLAASPWVSELYRLPLDFVRLLALVNLAYATFSLSLAARRRRPLVLIQLLVVANAVWAVLCWRWSVVWFDTASWFGLLHLAGEGLYVGGLAALEWRWREHLRVA